MNVYFLGIKAVWALAVFAIAACSAIGMYLLLKEVDTKREVIAFLVTLTFVADFIIMIGILKYMGWGTE